MERTKPFIQKVLFSVAVLVCTTSTATAQKALENSTTFDNWYVGMTGGASVKTTHTAILRNLNPNAGLRIGRHFTPVFGWAIEGTAYARAKQFSATSKRIKSINGHVLGTVNLSNWLGGYLGKPRCIEFVAVAGPGLNHVFGQREGMPNNDLTVKAGLDLTFNLGKARAWQLYLEPAICYNLDRYERTTLKSDYSALQLMAGINYKFKNSNGTHNFRLGEMRNQAEIDQLNNQINELRQANETKEKQMREDAKTITLLKNELNAAQEAAKNVKPEIVQQVVKQVVNNNVLQPTVIFGLGKSTVDAAQMASVAMIAKYMKNHPESRLLIKGFASPEGNPELNQRLSEKRAQSVKDVLVSRYGVSADRLEIKGMGATDELFDEVDFNRVATFTDLTK